MTIEAIVAGVAYELSNTTEFIFQEESDFGMPDVRRLTEAGPLQHGLTDVGFRMGARKLRLKLACNADNAATLDAQRAKLLSIFRPRNASLSIRKTLDSGARRQIDCHFNGGLSFRTSDRKGMVQVEVIELLAPDPTFYDPTAVAVPFGLTGGGGAFNVPLAIPWNVGSSVLDQVKAIEYVGTWKADPIITIYGPITDAVITNETTGMKLDFTGTTIDAGSYYVIDTRYGHKTVREDDGTNRIAALTDDSDLATFGLEADPDAPGGVNSVRVTGSGVTEATQVYMSYYTRYVGI